MNTYSSTFQATWKCKLVFSGLPLWPRWSDRDQIYPHLPSQTIKKCTKYMKQFAQFKKYVTVHKVLDWDNEGH